MNDFTTQELASAFFALVAIIIFFVVIVFVIAPKSIDTSYANEDTSNLVHKEWLRANTTKETEYQY